MVGGFLAIGYCSTAVLYIITIGYCSTAVYNTIIVFPMCSMNVSPGFISTVSSAVNSIFH